MSTNIIYAHECNNIIKTGDPFERTQHILQETDHMSCFSDSFVLDSLIMLYIHN